MKLGFACISKTRKFESLENDNGKGPYQKMYNIDKVSKLITTSLTTKHTIHHSGIKFLTKLNQHFDGWDVF